MESIAPVKILLAEDSEDSEDEAVVVAKHQGRIEVKSELGKGTTLRLPSPLENRRTGGGR